MGLFVLASAAFVSAGSGGTNNHYWVTNLDDNSTYWVKIIASQNTTLCTDTDHGMKPMDQGSLTVDTLNPVGHRVMNDFRYDTNVVREFMCGNEVSIAGVDNIPTRAYVAFYNPNNPHN